MKLSKTIVIFIVMILTLTFSLTSCNNSPDEPVTENPPSETPPEDTPTEQEAILEKLRKGMRYSEIVEKIGESGTKADLPTHVYYWRIKGQKLYVWFTQSLELSGKQTCTRFEFGENLQIELGQTYDEVVYVLGQRGTLLAYAENIYFWNPADTKKYPNSKYYIRFAPDQSGTLKVSNFGYGYDLDKLNSSMSYESVCTVFASEGKKISIENQVYGWDFFGETIVAEFERAENDKLLFKQHDFISTIDLVNLSYDEICEVIGSEGTKCDIDSANSNLYMWETNLNANLYISFNGDNVATDFSYEESIDFVENATTIEKALFIMGEPFDSNSNSFRWHTHGEMDIYMVFRVWDEKLENLLETPVLSSWFYVPHIPLLNGMPIPEAYEAMGEPDLVTGSGAPTFFWYIDEFVVRRNGIYVYIYKNEDAA